MIKEFRLGGFKGLALARPATKLAGGYLQKVLNVKLDVLDGLRKRYGDAAYINTDFRVDGAITENAKFLTGDPREDGPMLVEPSTSPAFVAIYPGGLNNYTKSWLFRRSTIEFGDFYRLEPASIYYDNPSSSYGLYGSNYAYDFDEYELLLSYSDDENKYYLHLESGKYWGDSSMPFASGNNINLCVPTNLQDGYSTEVYITLWNYPSSSEYLVRIGEGWALLPVNREYTIISPSDSGHAIAVSAVFNPNSNGRWLYIYVINSNQQIDLYLYDMVNRSSSYIESFGSFSDAQDIYVIYLKDTAEHIIFVWDSGDKKVYIYKRGTGSPILLSSFTLPLSTNYANEAIWGNKIHNYYNAYVLAGDKIYVGNSSVGYAGAISASNPDTWVKGVSAKDDDYYRFVYMARPYMIDSSGNVKTSGPVHDSNSYTFLKFQNEYILLRRGLMPLKYDGESFKPLSIIYKPSVSIAYAETTGEDPGDTFVFCYGDGERMGPCAIVKVPQGYGATDPNSGSEPGIKIRAIHAQDDDSIRLYGYILNENTGGQFISLFEDGYTTVERGEYKTFYVDSDHGTPAVNLGGYSQYTLGQYGVIPPQHPCPHAGYGDIYKGRLFVANTPDYPNRIWWSDINISQFDLDYWWIDLPGENPITAVKTYQNSLYIFTETEIYNLTGTPPVFAIDPDNPDVRLDTGSLTLRKIINGVGCINNHTVVDTPYGLVFLSRRGIYLLTPGGQLKELSYLIRDLFENSNYDYGNARSTFHQDKYYLAFDSGDSSMSDYTNDRILIYDFSKNAWLMDKYPAGGMLFDSVDGEFYIGSSGSYKIYKYDQSGDYNEEWSGSAVSAEFMTVEIDCGAPAIKKYFLRIYFDCQLTDTLAGTAFKVDIKVDGEDVLTGHSITTTELNNGLPLPLSAYGEKIQIRVYEIADEIIFKDILLVYNTREVGGKVSEVPSISV